VKRPEQEVEEQLRWRQLFPQQREERHFVDRFPLLSSLCNTQRGITMSTCDWGGVDSSDSDRVRAGGGGDAV
jgi:hypothetical protein